MKLRNLTKSSKLIYFYIFRRMKGFFGRKKVVSKRCGFVIEAYNILLGII